MRRALEMASCVSALDALHRHAVDASELFRLRFVKDAERSELPPPAPSQSPPPPPPPPPPTPVPTAAESSVARDGERPATAATANKDGGAATAPRDPQTASRFVPLALIAAGVLVLSSSCSACNAGSAARVTELRWWQCRLAWGTDSWRACVDGDPVRLDEDVVSACRADGSFA